MEQAEKMMPPSEARDSETSDGAAPALEQTKMTMTPSEEPESCRKDGVQAVDAAMRSLLAAMQDRLPQWARDMGIQLRPFNQRWRWPVEYRTRRYAEDLPPVQPGELIRCAACKQDLPAEAFNRGVERVARGCLHHGMAYRCCECVNVAARVKYAIDPEQERGRKREYRKREGEALKAKERERWARRQATKKQKHDQHDKDNT